MVRTGVFVRACIALAADSGSRHREMRNAVIRRPNVRLTCAAGSFIDRDERGHATALKNAPGLGPRQRRQVQGVLGGGLDVAGDGVFCY